MDWRIVATVKLANGKEFIGYSVFPPNSFPSKLLPLVYARTNSKLMFAFCGEGAVEGMDVKGKVVLHDKGRRIGRIAKGKQVRVVLP